MRRRPHPRGILRRACRGSKNRRMRVERVRAINRSRVWASDTYVAQVATPVTTKRQRLGEAGNNLGVWGWNCSSR